jgi:energy-coupling factor transporter ATP-binding protein EcfA2
MTAVPAPDEQSFEFTFELPDPDGPRFWRVHASCEGPSSDGHESYARSCRFDAQLGNGQHVTSWWKVERDEFALYQQAAERTHRGTFDLSLEGTCRGFMRMYRRRFREVLTNDQKQYRVSPGEVFDPPAGGDAMELVVREVEDTLFAIARARSRLQELAKDTSSSHHRLELPRTNVWKKYELLLTSDDPGTQHIRSYLDKFYREYAELRERLTLFLRADADAFDADISRLEFLGTQAIWAFGGARNAGSAGTGQSGLKPGLDVNVGGAPWPRECAVHIEWLSLELIRRFAKLTVEFQAPTDEGIGQWILLLGENGTGKTTLLRAIALSLIEPDFAQSFVTQSSVDSPLVRMETTQPTSWEDPNPMWRPGIALCLSPGLSRSQVWLTSVRGRERFEMNHALAMRPPVFAYGCRRGNALGGPEREADFNPLGNVATLFDPQAHLVHAEAWLRKLAFAAEKEPRDRALFEAVLDLLTDRDGSKEEPLLPGVRKIDVTPDRTWVLGPGDRRVPLSALSDGYLTTLGWLVDFLARWLEYARRNGYEIEPGFAAEMPAVVLVDELDLHLHPRWQMRVVPALAHTFPRTTFIATTHNPLTLSGMVGDERMRGAVHIIKERADGNLEIIQRDLEPGMSADEVLTHEWFGLRSTLDRDTLELLDKHRALLRQGVPEDDLQRRELEAELRRRLGRYADTPAERLAQQLVAKQFPDHVPEVDELSDDERDRLNKLYEAAMAQARGEGKSPPEQP